MASEPARAGADWLALREPADAEARAADLVDRLRHCLPARGPLQIHDLGSGTGSTARWLAPSLPGPLRWVLHARDADLLARVAALPPPGDAGGGPVVLETRHDDLTRLEPPVLRDADLVTASALLDMMTRPELERFVETCAGASCPVLVTLSVVGRVELTPGDALDDRVSAAFDAHQRRVVDGPRLLGPDAVGVAAGLFRGHGHAVTVRPSPWRLGPGRAALAAEWLRGWVAAAGEQQPELVPDLAPYEQQRLEQAAAGTLSVVVHHQDLLAVPRSA